MYPSDLQARVESGLRIVWPLLGARDQAALKARMQGNDALAAEDELLAASGFAIEFGAAAISIPETRPDQRKPEFVVAAPGAELPVECKHLLDQQESRELNAAMLQSGQGWAAAIDPQVDRDRLRRAIVKKLNRAQGGAPSILLVTSYTPWLLSSQLPMLPRRPNGREITTHPKWFD
jgi:hypothetical protein